jgi:SpoVK/Ycf46/Vps4 family AAA+-type ATPase
MAKRKAQQNKAIAVTPVAEAERPALPVTDGRILSPDGSPRPRGGDGDSMAKRMALFEVETPHRRLGDLIISAHTALQLRSLLTKIRYHRVLYDDFGLGEIDPYGGRTAINLYGPPGTGKSFAADAIANELGRDIIRVSYAEIESKYVGETPKNIKAAFQKARETNALLFFDEADSVLGRHLTNVTQSTDHAVNVSRSVMLLELDRFSGVTVFATNLAVNYDPAFVRRILGHIELPLPDADLRRQLWRYHIPARLPVLLEDADWEELIVQTAELAGGDILNIVVYAAAMAIEREGPKCTVTRADFLHAISATRRARQEVGVTSHSSSR